MPPSIMSSRLVQRHLLRGPRAWHEKPVARRKTTSRRENHLYDAANVKRRVNFCPVQLKESSLNRTCLLINYP